jgi:arylsulfatase A-like enzyme
VAGRKTEEDYFCARTMRDAAGWLEKNHGRQPFFLYVDTFDPHEPWDPPASYVKKYDPDYQGEDVIYPRYDRWRDFLSERELRHCRALYAGEASLVDRWTGHLLETIERLGLFDNTLVLFVADHGFYLGEHGFIGKSWIRDKTAQYLPLYTEVCRIPFLAHFPNCRAGANVAALAQTVHVAPTILDFLGVRAPDSILAPSLWPVLQGKEERVADFVVSSPALAEPSLKKPVPTNRASVTDGAALLVYGAAGSGLEKGATSTIDSQQRTLAPLTQERIVPELYDLKNDPGCRTNIAAREPDRARELHRRLVQFLTGRGLRRDFLPFFQKIEL